MAWFGLDLHPHEDRSVVTSPVVFMTSILGALRPAIGIVLEENPICVRWALLIFILEFVLIDVSLISWHEGDWPFNVAWKYLEISHS